jgi:toluene monooxygenase system protein E
VNLVLRPTLSEILLRQFGIVADTNHDQLTWLLLSNLAIDADRNARWSAALARYAITQRAENAAVLRHWVQRWIPRADEAAARLAHMLADLPEVGRDEEAIIAAAQAARDRVLSEAGVLAAIP